MKRSFAGMMGAAVVAMLMGTAAFGADASEPMGEPTLEMPTMHSLGVYWIVKGDDNRNAKIDFVYRKAGGTEWRKAPSLFRVDKKANVRKDGKSSVNVPDDAWLFAGSVLLLEPQTAYEMKLTLTDPDGGNMEKSFKQSTTGEPVAPRDMKELHVVPGSGGGAGTAADPCKGLKEAIEKAEPGTLVLLHKGTYAGNFVIRKNGEPGKPIIFRGAGDGEAFIDGQSMAMPLKDHAFDVTGQHDVWFEDLKIANAFSGIKAAGAQRIVMRRCNVSNIEVGFYCSVNEPRIAEGFFISDNVIDGGIIFPIPGEKWHKRSGFSIWVVGQGHDVCYNRISNVEDGPDTGDFAVPTAAIDFHHNDINGVVDDGSELDGSERNIRSFLNRYANSLTAMSFQPVHGGPVYCFKNVAYNFRTEATKLRDHATGPNSGIVLVHNTFVHMGQPWLNGGKILGNNMFSRDNLFIGTEGEAAYFAALIERADFDYDGFGGFSGPRFMKFVDSYATSDDVKAKGRIERHHVIVDPKTLFASGIQVPTQNPAYTPEVAEKEKGKWGTLMLNVYPSEKIDLRLNPKSNAANAGELLPEYGDDPKGQPYLGAYAPGSELPWYGPRSKK